MIAAISPRDFKWMPSPLHFPHHSIFFHHHSVEIKLHQSCTESRFFDRSPNQSSPVQFLFSRSEWWEEREQMVQARTFSTRQMERRKIVCRNGGKWKIDRRFGGLGFAPPARPFSALLSPLPFFPLSFSFVPFHSWSFWFACRDRGLSREARKAREKQKKRKRKKEKWRRPAIFHPPPVRPVFQLYYLRLWAGNYGSLTKRKEGREDYLFNPILHSHRQTSLLNSAKIRKCIKLLSFSFHGDKYGGIVRYFFPFLAFLLSWRKNGGGDSEIAQGWKALF